MKHYNIPMIDGGVKFNNNQNSFLYRGREEDLLELLKILNSAELSNVVERGKKSKIQKNPPHRKKMFSNSEVNEIKYKYTHFNTPIKELARQYKCSPKTIRNIIKNAY